MRVSGFVAGLVLAAMVVFGARVSVADPPPFSTWLQGMRQDAIAQGITPETFDRALAGVQPIPHIIDLDHAQPELTLTFAQYVERIVTPARREAAEQHYLDNKALLDEVGRRYGVPPRYIVALWGIETNFGQNIGHYPVFAALTTLAYDGRRAAFFRKELINALLIVQNDHVDPQMMIGSWAGAMGQSQFMPSSFLKFAVSFSGNGPPDIWGRPDDVFASIANYLASSGWQRNLPLGWQVAVPAGLDSSLIGITQKRTLAVWAAHGIKRVDRLPLAGKGIDSATRAALLEPDDPDGPSFLVTDNFNVILSWNNSSYFALAVGYLANSVN